VLFQHRFEEGAEQFRLDVAANPNDTEESIWCFLCEAQLYGIKETRKQFLEASYQRAVIIYQTNYKPDVHSLFSGWFGLKTCNA